MRNVFNVYQVQETVVSPARREAAQKRSGMSRLPLVFSLRLSVRLCVLCVKLPSKTGHGRKTATSAIVLIQAKNSFTQRTQREKDEDAETATPPHRFSVPSVPSACERCFPVRVLLPPQLAQLG